jgi:ABC-type transport system substrate-binding protein/DNA-binding SARP family transcriptional activator/streptogramin lyase
MAAVFRILGPLEATRDERQLALGGRRERAILGILLLHAGEVVSVERLIDGVWGDARPTSAKHMVHEYVSRLRQALDDETKIATRPPGYLLEPKGDALDADQFARLIARARTAAREQRQTDAVRAYDEALALWRGDTLADLALEGDALADATRLDEERRLAAEERVDSALELGHHRELIAQLEHTVAQAPLRERPRAQLMLALYRAGRQTDALERYRQGRALLVDHAGIEPGPELRDLERAILRHDPALARAPAMPDSNGRPERPAAGPVARRGRLAVILAALLIVAIGIGAVVYVTGRSSSTSPLTQIDASSAAAIDPRTNQLVDDVHVGSGPGRIAVGFGSLWVVNDFDNTISRIDVASGDVQTIPVDDDPAAIAVAGGFVWVACTGTRSVDRIDPHVDKRTQRIQVGYGSSGIAVSPGSLWVTDRLDDSVTEIDSTTGKVRRTLAAGATPSDVVYGLGALWIANESSSTISRVDPATGARREIQVGNGPESVAIGNGSVWVANSLDGTVWRIDPQSDVVQSVIGVGSGPSSVLARGNAIWVADSYGDQIVRIDPRTNTVVKRIAVGSRPQSLAAIDGRIWLSARAGSSLHRGGTLRLFDIAAPDSLDRAVGYNTSAWSVAATTGDGLVGFKRVGGLDGGTLVPDLATSLPVPSGGGRTYTFQLRRGIHYSDGQPVRASDLRRALERAFRVGSPGAYYYSELLGGRACSRSHCDLSRGVVTNDDAGTITLHLRAPDPELFYKLALPFADPVPRTVSLTKRAPLGVPGTGPYVVASDTHGRLLLVRNPHFRTWSAAAQPDGYPDRIQITFNSAIDKQLTAVEQGRADFMQSPLPAARFDEIETRFASQVHVFPDAATFALFLNTRVPPFDNLAARQAVNYAIDRNQAVSGIDGVAGGAGFGGAEGATVTCQILPAGMPGYRPYCPYTRDRTSDGVWTAPDLARARTLIAASGTKGEKVTFWTGPFLLERVVGRLAVRTLEDLGYRATLKTIGLKTPSAAADNTFFEKSSDSRTRVQAGFDAWSQDYPEPSSFLDLFTCGMFLPANPDNENRSELCNPLVDRAVEHARALQTRGAGQASSSAWAAADRLVTNLGAWVPLVNARNVVIVSRRVGNVQSSPQWGVLLDQMWVR